MPTAFKNYFNKTTIKTMAIHFKKNWPDFDQANFIKAASKNLSSLELKQRSEQIMFAMTQYLPADFKHASKIILNSLSPEIEGDIFNLDVDEKGIAGWAIMPLAHYVAHCGQTQFVLSMKLLKELTKRFSAEFAIRFFILNHPEKTLLVLKKWARDKNRHVRRLASEGCRPRLPWAMQLPLYIQDPSAVIEVLELLKDDKAEYVRRSVANNLNDIAKDHPELVANITKAWMQNASIERKKLLRHACRTLIKNGHQKTLQILGYKAAKLMDISLSLSSNKLIFGESLNIHLQITSALKNKQELLVDYRVHHQKANGKTSAKVFKWRTKTLLAGEIFSTSKKHCIKKISTRRYYPGQHRIEILINGQPVAQAKFNLLMP